MEYLELYKTTVLIVGVVGFLMLIQLLVVDVVGMMAKHPPGHSIEANHDDLLFRVVRAQANTNESVAIYILLVLFGMLCGANSYWLAVFSALYAAGRLGHMICYYANIKMARSAAFGLALVGLLGMLVVGVMPWL